MILMMFFLKQKERFNQKLSTFSTYECTYHECLYSTNAPMINYLLLCILLRFKNDYESPNFLENDAWVKVSEFLGKRCMG